MGKIDRFRVISSISKEITRCIDRVKVVETIALSSPDDRLFNYCDILTHACSECFRSYLDGIYWFDGVKWSCLDKKDIVLELAINDSLCSFGVLKKDLIKGRTRLVASAKSGAYLSSLGISPVVVGFRNGVWDFGDIDNPVRHEYKDRMPIIDVLQYDYDVDAECPVWHRFLDMILTKPQQQVLQKYLGLGCVDRKCMTHRIEETLWLVGEGGNGKSTIFEVVKAVFGADNLSYMPLGHIVTTNVDLRMRNIGRMAGKVFNYCSEIQADDITRCADTFKSLCSGEPQEVRSIAKNSWTVYDIPFFIFNMNKMPMNRSMDRAFVRRLLVIDFSTTVKKEDMDRELVNRLMGELSGIRNWCIDGYRKLVADGYSFGLSDRDAEALRQYEFENGQSVKLFCEDNGLRAKRYAGKWKEKPRRIAADNLYQLYCEYCEKHSQEPMTVNMFGRALAALRFNKGKYYGKIVYDVFSDNDVEFEMRM